MTQDIQPFRNSDLTQTTVRKWLSQQRTGIESGLVVSNGTTNPATSFVVNIASGVAWIGSSRVADDQSYVDLDLSMSAGSDKHYAIVGTYTPAETNPAPSMTFSAVVATPPARPTIPANSVKLADVFVPSAATGISGCTIKNVAKLPPRGDNNGDVIQENLLESNANVLFTGGGTFTYDGGTDTLSWSAAIDVVAPATSNEAVFESAPLAAGQIAIGSRTGAGDNSIFFVVWDRTTLATPGSPTALTMRVLDTDNPDPVEAAAFNTTSRDQILIIGMTVGGSLRLREGLSGVLPDVVAPADPPPRYLRMDPGGTHAWETVQDIDLVGGFQVIEWSDATYADAPTALATLLPSLQRRTNMVVRTRETTADTLQEWIWDGSNFVAWQPANARAPLQGVISGLGLSKNSTTQEVVIAEGQFYTNGAKVVTHAAKVIDGSVLADGAHIVYWDDSAGDFTTTAKNGTSLTDLADMPVAVIVVATNVVTKIVDVRRTLRDHSRPTVYTCGGDGTNWPAEFTHLNQAMLHASCFDDDVFHVSRFEVFDKYTFAPESMQGTVNVDNTSATVTGVGTSFRSDFDAGDFIVVGSTYAEIASKPVSDTSLTLTGNWPGSTLAGQAYSRDTTRGPNSQTVDFRRGEWGTSLDPVFTANIVGIGGAGNASPARVTWGISGETGVAPFMAFAPGSQQPWNISISDIELVNVASADAADDEMAYFVNTQEGFRVSNCRFNGGDAMSHLMSWVGGNSVFLGGAASLTLGASASSSMLEDCVFFNSFANATSEAFFMDNTPDAATFRVSGQIDFIRCVFDWNDVNSAGEVVSINAQSQTFGTDRLAVIRFKDCNVNLVGSLYRVQQSTGTDIHPAQDVLRIELDGGIVKGDAACDINPISGAGNVFARNLVIDGGTINLRGMARIDGGQAVNSAAVTLPYQCQAVNCDFETDGTLTWADAGPSLISPLGAGIVNALDQRSSPAGLRRSRILWGCDLTPSYDYETSGAAENASARLVVAAGGVVFPSGLVHVGIFTPEILHSAIDAGTKTQPINGAAVTTMPDGTAGIGNSTTTRPFFYCFVRKKPGDTTAVVRYDTVGPDQLGRPAAVGGTDAAGGYTVNDYAFVGTLTCWNALPTVDTATNDSSAIMDTIWKNGANVIHLGPGVRVFGIADAFASGSNYNQALGSDINGGGGATSSGTLLDLATYSADIRHCRAVRFSSNLNISELGTGAGAMDLYGPGFDVHGVQLATSEVKTVPVTSEAPVLGGATPANIRVGVNITTGGTTSCRLSGSLTRTVAHAFVEDCNSPRSVGTGHDWPDD